jgi:uncharacterized protein
MAHIEAQQPVELDEPVMIEGLPGVGLVGKIAADHLVETFDMTYYAACRCDGLPDVAAYGENDRSVKPPVRIYADEDRDLLALQSDVPVSPAAATEFAGCIVGWLADNEVFPIYASGLPDTNTKGDVPALYGVGTSDGGDTLATHDIDPPDETGLISGPTGALVAESARLGLDGAALVVEANQQFPDPEAARKLLVGGIGPIAGIEVDTDVLVEQAERIADARENLAQQMQQADDESTRAQPVGMFQ